MKILIGILLIVLSARMRQWGRLNYYRDETLKPLYQSSSLFWLIFSLAGIVAFTSGLILLVSEIVDAL